MIVACPECNGKVSDTVPACPHCGFRMIGLADARLASLYSGRAETPPMKSFFGPAVTTLILYFVFPLVGLIANVIWYGEATRLRRATGINPPGRGCLLAMLVALLTGLLVLLAGIWIPYLMDRRS